MHQFKATRAKKIRFSNFFAVVLFSQVVAAPFCHAAGNDGSENYSQQRAPLSPEQIEAIKKISIGVLNAHQSQRDGGDDAEQLLTLAQDLDDQIASEVEPVDTNMTVSIRRAERRVKNRAWVDKLRVQAMALASRPSPFGEKHVAKRVDLWKRWSDELQALTNDVNVPDRQPRLRQLRESIRLSRFQRLDDARMPLSPTMTMRSAQFSQ